VFARTADGDLPMRPDAISKRFTALARRLSHRYRLYGLRHFMATQLGVVAGAGTVRDRMGHGSLAVTSRYLHHVSEADRAAARYMGSLLDGQLGWQAPALDIREGVGLPAPSSDGWRHGICGGESSWVPIRTWLGGG
jgi:hypothetical protein